MGEALLTLYKSAILIFYMKNCNIYFFIRTFVDNLIELKQRKQ